MRIIELQSVYALISRITDEAELVIVTITTLNRVITLSAKI